MAYNIINTYVVREMSLPRFELIKPPLELTYVAYYGDSDEFQMSTSAPPSKSYSWCYKMATISLVGEEVKFTLGMRPLRGYIPRSVLVKQLIDIAGDHVSLGTVYADAEFDGISVTDAREEQNLSYLIRKSSEDRVDRFVADMDHDVAVKQSHEMNKKTGGETVTVTPSCRGSFDSEERHDDSVRDESLCE